jgi:hypothetical protein
MKKVLSCHTLLPGSRMTLNTKRYSTAQDIVKPRVPITVSIDPCKETVLINQYNRYIVGSKLLKLPSKSVIIEV